MRETIVTMIGALALVQSGVLFTLFLQEQQHMDWGLFALGCFVVGALCVTDWWKGAPGD